MTLAIERDTDCIHCGYNLRGLGDDGRCPECGDAVAATLAAERRRGAPADTRWLKRMREAGWCTVIAWIISLSLLLLLPAERYHWKRYAALSVLCAAFTLSCYGVWKLASV